MTDNEAENEKFLRKPQTKKKRDGLYKFEAVLLLNICSCALTTVHCELDTSAFINPRIGNSMVLVPIVAIGDEYGMHINQINGWIFE